MALDAELRSSTGKEPPEQLPPKHWFSRTLNDEEVCGVRCVPPRTRIPPDIQKIRQRRIGLEHYLRTLLTTKDSRWRTSFGWSDFLAVPSIKQQPAVVTAATWTTEHAAIASLLRSARAALLKRDALARTGDATARASGGEARRLLRDAGPRIDALDNSLSTISVAEGEKRRREDLVAGLRSEAANLFRMAEAGYRAPRETTATPSAPDSLWAPPEHKPARRAFGAAAAETSETRPLDDRGLVQLQHDTMKQQDDQLGVLTGLLSRQRAMGEEIATEIGQQNELLDQLEGNVDRVGGKMARAKRDMNRLK